MNRNQTATPELVKTPVMTEREAAYFAAVTLVRHIDNDLGRGAHHYRNQAGRLLVTLDQVVNAILADDLAVTNDAPMRLAA